MKLVTCSNTRAEAVMERRLGRPLQRSGCMFHLLEKAYEHLHDYYDGNRTGPTTYSGPLGKAIEEEVWKDEPVEFASIPNLDLKRRLVIYLIR